MFEAQKQSETVILRINQVVKWMNKDIVTATVTVKAKLFKYVDLFKCPNAKSVRVSV